MTDESWRRSHGYRTSSNMDTRASKRHRRQEKTRSTTSIWGLQSVPEDTVLLHDDSVTRWPLVKFHGDRDTTIPCVPRANNAVRNDMGVVVDVKKQALVRILFIVSVLVEILLLALTLQRISSRSLSRLWLVIATVALIIVDSFANSLLADIEGSRSIKQSSLLSGAYGNNIADIRSRMCWSSVRA